MSNPLMEKLAEAKARADLEAAGKKQETEGGEGDSQSAKLGVYIANATFTLGDGTAVPMADGFYWPENESQIAALEEAVAVGNIRKYVAEVE